MTEREAINRIAEHMIIHKLCEPHAVLITEALKMGMSALEKQIPKEASTMKYRNDYDWICNSCDTTFEYIRYTTNKPKYCSNCGQAIKWE